MDLVAVSNAMASGWKNEGIFVKSGPKITRAAHMRYFLSRKMESANGMAILQIFETLLGSIATFFTLEAKLQIRLNFGG